jgi:hypothetical protein
MELILVSCLVAAVLAAWAHSLHRNEKARDQAFEALKTQLEAKDLMIRDLLDRVQAPRPADYMPLRALTEEARVRAAVVQDRSPEEVAAIQDRLAEADALRLRPWEHDPDMAGKEITVNEQDGVVNIVNYETEMPVMHAVPLSEFLMPYILNMRGGLRSVPRVP